MATATPKPRPETITIGDVTELNPQLAVMLNIMPRRVLGRRTLQEAYEQGLQDAFEMTRIREARAEQTRKQDAEVLKQRFFEARQALGDKVSLLQGLLVTALKKTDD
jgi:hypothetical protein